MFIPTPSRNVLENIILLCYVMAYVSFGATSKFFQGSEPIEVCLNAIFVTNVIHTFADAFGVLYDNVTLIVFVFFCDFLPFLRCSIFLAIVLNFESILESKFGTCIRCSYSVLRS